MNNLLKENVSPPSLVTGIDSLSLATNLVTSADLPALLSPVNEIV